MKEDILNFNGEIFSTKKFEEEARNRGDKILHFGTHSKKTAYDKEGFDHTKITNAVLLRNGIKVPLEKISTWAGLLRSVNKALKKGRDKIDVFEETFNGTIAEVLEDYGLGMNYNFSPILFIDDSFITSEVYRNNENHALEVWRGKKICAVYAGEVVVVLNALVAASGDPETDEKLDLFISYRKRHDSKEENKIYSASYVNENVKDEKEFYRNLNNILKSFEGTYQDKNGKIFCIKVENEENNKEKIISIINEVEEKIQEIKDLLDLK